MSGTRTIATISDETTPLDGTAKVLVSADGTNTKRAALSDVSTYVQGPGIDALTSKSTPVDADELPLSDSAASNVGKKLTWANLKATLKAYLDTLYAGLSTNNTFAKGQRATIQSVAYASTITLDFTYQGFSIGALTGNTVFANPTNIVAGQSGSIRVPQDSTGGRTGAFGSYWKTAGGVAPSFSTAPNAVDRIDYWVATTTEIHYALAKGVA